MKFSAITLQFDNPSQEQKDIVIAWLGTLPVEGIEELPEKLVVYLDETKYERQEIESLLAGRAAGAHIISEESVAEKNWNREWEKKFQPVVVQDQCIIRAPFHRKSLQYSYEIIIEPKMSFGTGHHETTRLMIEEMLSDNFAGMNVLDAGCGTGILSILASRMGAEAVLALDNDEWAYRNCRENIRRNHAGKVRPKLGTLDDIQDLTFDRILANINLNILLQGMEQFADLMKKDARLFLSGIYREDCEVLECRATGCGLLKVSNRHKNNWAMMTFQKI